MKNNNEIVEIYTDGACSGNPGPGGWAAVLIYKGIKKEISGFEENTTNNRMELKAAIEGLKALKRPCKVNLYSDSSYLINAFNEGWIEKWQKNNWLKS
ncbi:ribonuclease HI, partial [Caldanaerobacter subterraneus KAk]